MTWKSADPMELLKAAESVAGISNAVAKIVHPVLKVLVDKLVRLHACAASPCLRGLVDRCFLELCELKLGLPSVPAGALPLPTDNSWSESDKEVLQKIACILGKDMEKQGKALQMVRASLPTSTKGHDKAKENTQTEQSQAAEKPMPSSDQTQLKFESGDIVRLSVSKDKKKFNGMKAVVISCGQLKCGWKKAAILARKSRLR